MASEFFKDFDTLLEQILTSYQNLDSAPDVTEGSITFIKGACLASMLYGLYRYQDFIFNSLFPDTAQTDELNHWGSIYGISRLSTDTDTDYLNKILNFLRQPPAGGTALDYETWTLASATVDDPLQANTPETILPADVDVGNNWIRVDQPWYDEDAVQFTTTGVLPSPLATSTTYYIKYVNNTYVQISTSAGGSALTLADAGSGIHTMTSSDTDEYYIKSCTVITPNSPIPSLPGTVDIIIVPGKVGTDAQQYTNPKYTQIAFTLTQAALDYVEVRRPVTAASNTFQAAVPASQPIYVTVTPITSDIATMQNDIGAYLSTFSPGDPLYTAQIEAICLRAGAVNANVTTPTGDVAVANNVVIVSGGIIVTPANSV